MSTINHTIDDSQWATPALALTAGWNMLREGGANEYLSESEMEIMRPLLGEFWNSSVSWTAVQGAATTLSFIGRDVWAYGISGPAQGSYRAIVDGELIGNYSARSETTDYRHLLFEVHNLADGEPHTLTLVNDVEGASLAFDYAIIQTDQNAPALPAANSAVPFTATTTSSTASSAAPSSSDGLQGLFNATSPTSTTSSGSSSSSSPLGEQTPDQAAGGAGLTPQVTYSPAQLSALGQRYSFEWNAASYFVVTFAAVVLAIVLAFATHHMISGYTRQRSKVRGGSSRDGESFLISGHGRVRPNSRILSALRNGKISNPVPSEPSESGHSYKEAGPSEGGSYAEERDRFHGA